jgi:hypothetical protein
MRCVAIYRCIARSSGFSSWCAAFHQYKLLGFLDEPLCSLSLLRLDLFGPCNHGNFSVSRGCHVYVRQKTAGMCRVLLHDRFTAIWEAASRIAVDLARLCGRGCSSCISARICDSRTILWLMKYC